MARNTTVLLIVLGMLAGVAPVARAQDFDPRFGTAASSDWTAEDDEDNDDEDDEDDGDDYRDEDSSGEWADKGGSVGLGVNGMMGGTVGMHFRWYPVNAFGIQLSAGYWYDNQTFDTPDTPPIWYRESTVSLGLSLSYKVLRWDTGHMSLLGGADLNFIDMLGKRGRNTAQQGNALEMGFTVGGLTELFLADFVSLHGVVGIRLSTTSGHVPRPSAADFQRFDEASSVSFGTIGDLVAGLGLTFWF